MNIIIERDNFIKWSQKNVREKFKSDFRNGFPIIHCYNNDFKQAYGELKDGKKIEFRYNELEWKEKQIK
jgi:hypothetical protein